MKVNTITILIICCLFFSNIVFSQKKEKQYLTLPTYEIKDSSFLSICEMCSYYSNKVFGRKKNTIWALDFYKVKGDTTFYNIIGTEWEDFDNEVFWDTNEAGIGIVKFESHIILIKHPTVQYSLSSYPFYYFNNIFTKTNKVADIGFVPAGSNDLFHMDFYRTSLGFACSNVYFFKNGRITPKSCLKQPNHVFGSKK
ncbi:hypothetical protein R9C00_24055 [Flammeovirgaceae bacterium SG7u.111]|nr:hypothetical protein [Flammeovirgaceae bacterium SG7u.132]WPO34776.1 hypothetical protein R9C00_24055 [Flammeovirgaceae bacterium SG7u.111]